MSCVLSPSNSARDNEPLTDIKEMCIRKYRESVRVIACETYLFFYREYSREKESEEENPRKETESASLDPSCFVAYVSPATLRHDKLVFYC